MTDSLQLAYRRFVRERGASAFLSDELPDAPPRILTSGELDSSDVDRAMRELEAVRQYASYASVGTEPHLDWLFRLGTVASRKGPHQAPRVRAHRDMLRLRTDDVRRGMQRLGLTWPAVHVDLFPTGDLNAMSVPVPDGHLVLINIGLMDLTFDLLKLHMLTQRVGPGGEDGALLTERQVELRRQPTPG